MTTVHYRGSQPDPVQRKALIRDLAACAKGMDWGSIDVADEDAGLAGIILQPTNKLEPIPFLFDNRGRLHALADLLAPGGEPICFVAVKTHYAGTEAHQWLTRLLRHIKDSFMPNLAVTDESGYWDHGDEAQLKAYFTRLDRLAINLCNHLANDVAPSPSAGPENLINCNTLAAEMARWSEGTHLD